MTDAQILEIASEHLHCNMSVNEWSGGDKDLLKFARAILEKGYNGAYGEGWREGYNVGVIEYSND